MKTLGGNFGFLQGHDPQLVRLGVLAERYFHDDPNTCIIKLRQFGEALAQLIAATSGQYTSDEESQSDLLRRLRFERIIPPEVADLFHSLRTLGRDASFAPGPFQPPTPPPDATAPIRAELERLKAELLASKSAAEQARLIAEDNARARQTAEQRAAQEAEERATWEELAQEAERAKAALHERLAVLQQATK